MTPTGLPLPRNTADLSDRIADAFATLRKIPSPKNSAPGDMRIGWPDYVRDTNEAYGYSKARGGAIKATAAEIARMEEVLAWIARCWPAVEMRRVGLPEDAGAVAWFRVGAGWQMKRLAEWRLKRWGVRRPPGGTNRESLRAMVQRALEHMLSVLQGQQVAPAPIEAELPAVRVEVILDRTVTQRVQAIRENGSFVVRTRHARAEHREVPVKGRRE